MQTSQPIGFLSGNVALRLAEKSIDKETSAHTDPAMNTPNRQFDAGLFECFAPGKDVLIDAINKSTVEIEKKRWCQHFSSLSARQYAMIPFRQRLPFFRKWLEFLIQAYCHRLGGA